MVAGNTKHSSKPAVRSGTEPGVRELLPLCGIAATAVLAIGTVVAASTWDGYSHQSQVISELGGVAAPYPAIQNATFFAVGLLLVGFAIALNREFGRWIGPGLIAYFGFTIASHPVFPCDPGCDFVTTTGSLHNLTALVGFVAVIAGMLVVGRQMRHRPDWSRFGTWSMAAAILTLLVFIVWLMTEGLGLEAHWGTLQRVFLAIVFVWVVVAALRLFDTSQPTRSPP